MTLREVYNALKALNYPIAYHHFEGTPSGVPFLVYYSTGSTPMLADDECWVNVADVVIEFYTEVKDLEGEEKIETALAALGLVWSKTEVWIESESLYQISYETEVM